MKSPASSATLDRSEFRGTSRFELRAILGAGGMGVVYEAFDRELGTRIALKYLPNQTPESIYAFKREFRSLQDLQHENLVHFGELVHESEHFFFTMELVEGVDIVSYCRHGDRPVSWPKTTSATADSEEPTLDGKEHTTEVVRARSKSVPSFVDETRVRRAFAQLVNALMALHAAHKVHRDIKPGNVLVGSDGRVVLLDFGVVSEALENDLSRDPGIIGSVAYMAPEQAQSGKVTGAADYYALGVMLFEVLTHERPFSGRAAAVLAAKRGRMHPAIEELAPESPKDLAELCHRLLNPRPELRPTGPEVLDLLHLWAEPSEKRLLEDDSPFVGRTIELALLDRALSEASLGAVRVVHLQGRSGTGKTRLIRQFFGQLRGRRDVAVLRGRCSAREHLPYKALDGVIDDLTELACGALREKKQWPNHLFTTELLSAFPSLGRAVPVATRQISKRQWTDPYVRRVRLQEDFRNLFSWACRDRTVVLLIDDAQSVDIDSIALLSSLVRSPTLGALLILSVGQPTSENQMRQALDGRLVELENLSQEESSILTEALLSRARVKTGLGATPAHIALESGGHPFFIEALVREALRADGHVVRVANLEAALSSRVHNLRPEAKVLVQLASVAEHPMPLRVLLSAASIAQDGRFPAFLELQLLYGEHLLRFEGSANLVEPYHDRIAAAVRAGLTAEGRIGLHRAIALALEGEVLHDPGELAVHWSQAGEAQKAAKYALDAACAAEHTLAFARAAQLYDFALKQWPDHPSVGELWERLGSALANAGLGAPAAQALLRAADYSSETQRLDLQRRAADQLFRSGHVDTAEPIIQQVLRTVGISVPRSPVFSLLWLLFFRARLRLRGLNVSPAGSVQLDPEALVRLNACWSVALGLSMVNNIRGACLQTRHLLLALDAGQPLPLLRALGAEASYTAVAGHRAKGRVEVLLARASEIGAEIDDPQAEGFRTLMHATSHFLIGEWGPARTFAERAASVFVASPAGAMWELTSARTFGIWADFYLGDLSGMRTKLEEFIPEAEARGDRYAATLYRAGLACMAWLAEDRPEVARARVIEAESGWSRSTFDFQTYLNTLGHALIDLYEGDPCLARRRIVQAWPALRASQYLRIQNLRIEANYFRGVAALSAQAAGNASNHLRRDAKRCAALLRAENTPCSQVLAEFLSLGLADISGTRELTERWKRLSDAARALGLHLFAEAAKFRQLAARGDSTALDDLRDHLRSQQVRNPDRLCGLLAPGRPIRDARTHLPF